MSALSDSSVQNVVGMCVYLKNMSSGRQKSVFQIATRLWMIPKADSSSEFDWSMNFSRCCVKNDQTCYFVGFLDDLFASAWWACLQKRGSWFSKSAVWTSVGWHTSGLNFLCIFHSNFASYSCVIWAAAFNAEWLLNMFLNWCCDI